MLGKMHVVSTGLNAPTQERCVDSVLYQEWSGIPFGGHHYIEASCQIPRVNALLNQRRAVQDLDPEDVVVLLDGDDWLAHNRVVEKVYDMHSAGAWVTYGSFALESGQSPWKPGAYSHEELLAPRRAPWRGTHLKTIRAGLMQRTVIPSDWFDLPCGAWDMIWMMAAIEMAGPDRVTYCPDVLYCYNAGNSFEANADMSSRMALKLHERQVRNLQPYARLENL